MAKIGDLGEVRTRSVSPFKALVIDMAGTVAEVSFDEFEDVQHTLGGPAQAVALGPNVDGWVGRDAAHRQGLPNRVATHVATALDAAAEVPGGVIKGPLVLTGKPRDGQVTDVPGDVIGRARAFAREWREESR